MQFAVQMTVRSASVDTKGRMTHYDAKTVIPCLDRDDAMHMCHTLTGKVRLEKVGNFTEHDVTRAFEVVCVTHTSKGKLILSYGEMQAIASDFRDLDQLAA